MITKGVNWGVVGFLFELCALTIWVGGLVVIIVVVIPAVFNSFGMEPAGRFLRRVFDGYGLMTVGILVLLGALALMRHRNFGNNPSHMFSVSSAEWGLLAGMALVTFSILGVLGPQAVALQEQAFEAISKEEKDLAYGQFFRLHMVVRALHLVNLGLAASLFIVKLRKALFHQSMANL
jgi:amino acid transporter